MLIIKVVDGSLFSMNNENFNLDLVSLFSMDLC